MFKVDEGMSTRRIKYRSRENGFELLEAREAKFGRLKLQRLRKERDFVDIFDLKVRGT
jgi:hypothetical protein